MKLSAFLGAVGVGLCVACAAGALATLNAWGWPPHVFVLLFFCFGGAALAVDGGLAMVVGWRQAHVEIEAKHQDNKRAEVTTAERLAALAHAAEQAIIATDDDELLDTADLPKLERQREQELAHWQVFARRLVAAGAAYGWGRDTLTKGPTRVTTQPGWNVGTDLLQAAGYLYKDGAGTRLLVAEADWTAARLWEKLAYPSGEPPEIVPPPYNSATTPANNGKTAIEGVAVPARD